MNKDKFLQIRLTALEKEVIGQQAHSVGLDVSTWVKQQLFPRHKKIYIELINSMTTLHESKQSLAALNDLLHDLSKDEFVETLTELPKRFIATVLGNYIASMIDFAANQKNIFPPSWTEHYKGTEEPFFSTDLKSLRLHLLRMSPAAFKKRNIFIDSSVGMRL